jgi:DNA repair photolyase
MPLTIITKNPMVVRDADLLAAIAARVDVMVYFSVSTLDHVLWRKIEPRTSPPEARLRALSALRERGIDAGVLCAPIVPDLTDSESSLLSVALAAKSHGAIELRTRPLQLDPGVKDEYLAFLAAQFPPLLPRTIDLFAARGVYPTLAYLRSLDARVERVRTLAGFTDEPRHETPPRDEAAQQLQLLLR